MTILTRIRNLEKSMGADKDHEIRIKVTRSSSEEWRLSKMIFEAKRILGMLTPKQIRSRIFVGVEEDQGLYENMTKDEAKAVLDKYGDDIDLDEGVPA